MENHVDNWQPFPLSKKLNLAEGRMQVQTVYRTAMLYLLTFLQLYLVLVELPIGLCKVIKNLDS